MAGKKGSSRYPECSLCVSSQTASPALVTALVEFPGAGPPPIREGGISSLAASGQLSCEDWSSFLSGSQATPGGREGGRRICFVTPEPGDIKRATASSLCIV